MRFKKGDHIGENFLVLDGITGGMGEVYFCYDLDINDMGPRVLKTLQKRYSRSDDFAGIFKREALTWVSLAHHPNIVRCFMTIYEEDTSFMVLEWVHNDDTRDVSLRGAMKGRKGDARYALRILFDLCAGLAYADTEVPGIVHCDLKPENVLIDSAGIAKITDFGLARVLRGASGAETKSGLDLGLSHTSGRLGGTPLYMAPEQWSGGELDQRSDIYALGCILFELLSGNFVFGAHSVEGLREQHMYGDPPQPQGALEERCRGILQKCLAKEKNDRFFSCKELSGALQDLHLSLFGEKIQTRDGRVLRATDYGNMAVTFHREKSYDMARSAFKKAFELDPKLSRGYNNRGLMHIDLKEYDKAFEDFGRALEINPRFAEALSNRSALHLLQENYEEALNGLNEALAIDGYVFDALKNRARVHTRMENYQEALADAEKVRIHNSKDRELALIRGTALRNLEDYEQAIAELEKVANDPTQEGLAAFIELLKSLIAKGEGEVASDRALRYARGMGGELEDYMLKLFAHIFEENSAPFLAVRFYTILASRGDEEAQEKAVANALAFMGGNRTQE